MKSPFTAKVIKIIAAIPAGKVSTYGIIAAHANNKRGARQVARILHSSSFKYDLPWHRVVNRNGKISLKPGQGYEKQMKMLLNEGIFFDEYGRIDFSQYLWWPRTS
jgi:methylated-DNA-protein-cysteine methyltransferase related protein